MTRFSSRQSWDESDQLDDGTLLERFRAGSHDEANRAFAQIVRRHQAIVLGVCRRILKDEHDAEDAFQATFLLLARKSKQVKNPRALAGWLHRVAVRICLRLRDRHRRHPELMDDLEQLPFDERKLQEEVAREAILAIDEELERLPDQQRSYLILCALEGMSYSQVARRLGVTQNQVKWGLSRARNALRLRLARRGLAFSSGMMAVLASHQGAMAAPASLSVSTAELATRFVYCPATLSVASKPILLAYEGLHVMLLTKLKTAVLVTLALSTLGMGSFITIASAASSRDADPAAAPISQDDEKEKAEARVREKLARAEAERARAIAEEQRMRAEEQRKLAQEQELRLREQMKQQMKAQQEAELARRKAAEVQEQMRRDYEDRQLAMEAKLREAEARLVEMQQKLVATERQAQDMRAQAEIFAQQAKVARAKGDEAAARKYEEQRVRADEAHATADKMQQKIKEYEALVRALAAERETIRGQFGQVERERHQERQQHAELSKRRRDEERMRAREEYERALAMRNESGEQLRDIVARVQAITQEQRARTEELSQQVREIRDIQEKILAELRSLRESRSKRWSGDESAADVGRQEKSREQQDRYIEALAMSEFKEAQARLEKKRVEEYLQDRKREQVARETARIADLKSELAQLKKADKSEANQDRIAALTKMLKEFHRRVDGYTELRAVEKEATSFQSDMNRKMQKMAEELDRLRAEKEKMEKQLRMTERERLNREGERRRRKRQEKEGDE